jgi:hypothetical protein
VLENPDEFEAHLNRFVDSSARLGFSNHCPHCQAYRDRWC